MSLCTYVKILRQKNIRTGFKNKICLYVLMSRFKTEEQKNRFLRTKLCLYVLMSRFKDKRT